MSELTSISDCQLYSPLEWFPVSAQAEFTSSLIWIIKSIGVVLELGKTDLKALVMGKCSGRGIVGGIKDNNKDFAWPYVYKRREDSSRLSSDQVRPEHPRPQIQLEKKSQ